MTIAKPSTMAYTPLSKPFRTEYAVKMACESCVTKVDAALSPLRQDVSMVRVSVESQTVVVDGVVPPSRVLAALRATGMSTVLRGFSALKEPSTTSAPLVDADHPGRADAAVCIFETFPGSDSLQGWAQNVNVGLARLIALSPTQTLVDVSVSKVPMAAMSSSGNGGSSLNSESLPTTYSVSINEFGDVSHGVQSTGDPIVHIGEICITPDLLEPTPSKTVGPSGDAMAAPAAKPETITGSGSGVFEIDFPIWQAVGRSLVLTPKMQQHPQATPSHLLKAIRNSGFGGVIARSAGIFENSKYVCSCSGQTIWQEPSL